MMIKAVKSAELKQKLKLQKTGDKPANTRLQRERRLKYGEGQNDNLDVSLLIYGLHFMPVMEWKKATIL